MIEDIKFTQAEKDIITLKIKRYFEDELQQDIGSFEAEFLLDFFAHEIGNFYYNRGLYDAQTLMSDKLEEISHMLLDLEKPVSDRR